MYRLLVRDQCKSAFQKTLQNVRQSSQQHQHPQTAQQAGFGKFIVIVAPFLAAGGAITYAKHDKDFRKTLEKNIPGAEYVLKAAIDDDKPFDSVTKKIDGITSSVTNLFGSSEKKEDKPAPPLHRKIEPKVPAPKTAPKEEAKPVQKESPKAAAPKAAVASTLPPLPTEIVDLEKAIEVAASLAVKEYNKAIQILNEFNEDVRKVVDEAIEKSNPALWTSLKNKTSARDTSVSNAERSARDAIEKIEKCEIALSKAASTANHEQITVVRNKIQKLSDHINKVKDDLFRAKDSANISEKYWKKVESARNYFIDEIESLFPGLNLAEKKLNLSKDDLDLFITHAYTHVLAYQKELQRIQTDGEIRLKRAIDALRGSDQTQAVNSQLEYLLEKEKRSLALENQKKLFMIRAQMEKDLRYQLKSQSEAHVEHLKDAVDLKESEMKRVFNIQLDEKLATEKAAYKLQLASMVGKLKGMEAALKARAESEKCAHQAQGLWAACQALWATVKMGEPGVHWKNKLRPLKNEIKAVKSAAATEDELVKVVLENLPKEAQERGVFPEDALRERFINVEKVARKLALVPEGGASLPIYFLSYLQSALILRADEPVSKEELQNSKFDFSKLDTYDILNRARYYMDRGDLLQTVKYMNLLQGAPRKIASDWLKEARLLLETQQAANTLMVHAAASGLLYL
ncbi:IMMT family protein [Megaselia abdita]